MQPTFNCIVCKISTLIDGHIQTSS